MQHWNLSISPIGIQSLAQLSLNQILQKKNTRFFNRKKSTCPSCSQGDTPTGNHKCIEGSKQFSILRFPTSIIKAIIYSYNIQTD